MTHLVVKQVSTEATIQDGGRFGHLRLGFTEGGAADPLSMKLANLLVNNLPETAGIEIAYGGLVLESALDCWISVTGASCDLFVNDVPVEMACRHTIRTGDLIRVGQCHHGVYSFLAISGGVDSPAVLGSRSTVAREHLGGISGRPLRNGDRIPIDKSAFFTPRSSNFPEPISEGCLRTNYSHLTLRILPGFDYEDFDPAAVSQLLYSDFKVTGASNRMAIQLKGPVVSTGITQVWSEGTCYGCLQIPGNGQPLVLLNDRQTIGGYPKFGAITPADCIRLAQSRPGCTVNFELVPLEQAERLQWLSCHYQDTLLSALGAL